MKTTTTYQRSFVSHLHRTIGVQAISRDGANLIVRAGGSTFHVYPHKAV